MNTRNLEQLLNATNVLRYIHTECAESEHARQGKDDGEWQPYIPTDFIYSFFTFNTLYNINWAESLNIGKIWSLTKRDYDKETDKIEEYITFCCQDAEFVESYRRHLVNFIKCHYGVQELLGKLQTIERDPQWSGNLRNENVINDFHNACENLFLRGECNKDILMKIVTLIYKVRCNLFHGIKTMKELNNEDQRAKLKIYSLFIVTLNQMVFSYLDYLKDGCVYNALDKLKDRRLKRNSNYQMSNL